MNSIELTAPDDWHSHLRDGAYLSTTAPDIALHFKRAIIMPNLKEPITTVHSAQSYYTRIKAALPGGADFMPLMTLYLSEDVTPSEIKHLKETNNIMAVKWYPKGATTHSDKGVPDIAKYHDTLQAMSEYKIPLLIHGEVIDKDADIFERESLFLTEQLAPIIESFPELKIVLEHISTQKAVDFILEAPSNVVATITAHHLMLNRNDLLAGGIKPHHYCLPILKKKSDQRALIKAATSGNPKFFLGTDSAPHEKSAKESACGCAGIYTAPYAMALYTQVFDQENALDKLEGFASHHGADFYNLPRNKEKITLIKEPWQVPLSIPYADSTLIPFMAGQTLNWQVMGGSNG